MKTRIISALIAMAIFIPIIILGDWPVLLLVVLLSLVCLYEILKMNRIHIFSIPGMLSSIGLLLIVIPDSLLQDFSQYQTNAMVVIALLLLSFTALSKNRFTFVDMGFCLLSLIYVGFGFMYFYETREAGLFYILFALFIVWGTDTGAYIFGRSFGKHKLWPQISPNKTVEGAVGGFTVAILVALAFYYLGYLDHLNIVFLMTVTIILSFAGQLGDLVESALKRHFDVKDSGTLMPGHGGMLDRFDSLLFVLPVMHIFPIIS